MDVAQYVGKFLVKNNFCSIPGLGVIEIKKTIPTYNTGTNEMSSAVHYITYNPIGTIDDSFASFIANRENVSIANASNAISDFAKNVKLEASRRGKYELDYIGDFILENNKLVFKQSNEFDLGHSAFQYKSLSYENTNEQTQSVTSTISKEYAGDSYATVSNVAGKFNWSSAIFLVLLAGLLGLGAYLGYNYWKNSKENIVKIPLDNNTIENTNTISIVDTTKKETAIDNNEVTPIDTTTPTVTTPTNVQPTPPSNGYKVAILSFTDQASADKKSAKLKSFGNNTEVVNSNGSFVVAINTQASSDTAKLVDSLRKFFNPKGPVYILK